MKKKLIRLLCFILVFGMTLPMGFLPASAADIKSILDITASNASKVYFRCDTDKNFTSFEVGEDIVFKLTLFADMTSGAKQQLTAPYFYYSFAQDDGQKSSGYAVPDANGVATISTKMTRPGAVLATVVPYNESKQEIKIMSGSTNIVNAAKCGAIADASKIKTTLPEPSDFDQYWADQLKLLDACAPEIYSIYKISEDSSYTCYAVKVNCIGNPAQLGTTEANKTYVSFTLSVPKSASAGSLKLKAGYHWQGVSKCTLDKSAGYVRIHVCAHSIEPYSDDPNYYTNIGGKLAIPDYPASIYGFSTEENKNRDTVYFRYMLLRDVQAVRFMLKYFGPEGVSGTVNDCKTGDPINVGAWKGLWNGIDLETSGSSQGGFQSLAVAGLIPQVTDCAADIPWFANLSGRTDSKLMQSGNLPSFADGLLYYDTAYFAKRIRATVTITPGAADTTCPVYSTQAIFNNLNTDAVIKYEQGEGHSQKYNTERGVFGIESKKTTLYEGDTYKLPFEVKKLSSSSLASVKEGVLTAKKAGTLIVTYTNGTTRNIEILAGGIAGDANRDKLVDISDAVLLAQYLAEWDVDIDLTAANCNGDDVVDISDAVLLAQYLAEWEVELIGGKPVDDDPGEDEGEDDPIGAGQDDDYEIEADDIT